MKKIGVSTRCSKYVCYPSCNFYRSCNLDWIFPKLLVFFGNLVGGLYFVELPYFISYNKKLPTNKEKTEIQNKSISA